MPSPTFNLANVNQVSMKVMFDSGATTSFISIAALQRTTHLPIRFTQQLYLMADGYTTFEVIGTVKIFIEFNQMKTSIVARIVNSLCADCILGMDYINKYKVNLNNKDKKIQIHTFNNMITIPMEDQVGSIRMLCRLINPTCIYPYQEKRIKIATQMSLHSSVLVKNHVTWISIYNLTSTVRYLKRNVIVGVAVSPHITSAVTTRAQAKAKINPHKLTNTKRNPVTRSSTNDQPQEVVGHEFDISIISEAQIGDKLYQEKVLKLKSELLKAYHVAPWSGHFGFRSTYFKLKHKYWWPDMKTTIKNCIQSCSKCHNFNANHHQPDLPSKNPKDIYTYDKSHVYFPHFTRTLGNFHQKSQSNMGQSQTYRRMLDRYHSDIHYSTGDQVLKRVSINRSKIAALYSDPMTVI
ncbi:unnamed protein product [Rotaria sp. Silwood1]|nr:unnamed protein product [Rotaria sp. Silwood1]CAF1684139.1 unnamed protein product [Rotaria sp. Silwood1]